MAGPEDPMTLLHVLHYSAVGGIENYTRDLFVELEARGHRNVLVNDGMTLPGLEQPGRHVYQVPELNGRGSGPSAALARQLERIVRDERCDVAYVHTTMNGRVASSLIERVPVVYFAHTYDAISPSGARFFARGDDVCELVGVPDWRCLANAYVGRCNTRRPDGLWKRYRTTVETGQWARRSEAFVCDSRYVLDRHVENGFIRERGHVLPTPVRIPPPPHERSERGLVMFVGRITPEKGLRYLIRAFALVGARARLLVVGEGRERQAMADLADDLGISDRVEFVGSVTREQVTRLYARATAVVVPSVWPEPWGMVGPEAMAHSIPVIAFRVGGIPEWLTDLETGYLVEPKDLAGLADRIGRLIRDEELGRRLGAAGRRIAEDRFGMVRHADGLVRVLRSAVEDRAPSSGRTP